MDPIKPSDSGSLRQGSSEASGSSPISPQIKVPPAGLQGTPSLGGPASPSPSPNRGESQGGSVPPNLPVKEGADLTSTPPSKPPMPGPQPSPQPSPDIKLKPSSPPLPPPVSSPTPPPPKAETPGAPVFKSSIRTMQEDIAAIKRGQAPTGFQIEKQMEKDVTPPPTAAPGPKITMPPKPTPEIRLGEPEKAKPLPGIKLPPAPPGHPPAPPLKAKPLPEMEPGLAVPPARGTNIKRLIFLGGGLAVVAFLIWFFALRGPSAPEVTISPTPPPAGGPTPTPTATPVSIEGSFSIVDSVSVALGANFTTRFAGAINKEPLISSREPALYTLLNPATGDSYALSEFFGGLLIQAPAELTAAAKDSFYLTVLYKSDNVEGYGLLIGLKDPTSALTAMSGWEGTMTPALKDLFLFDPQKAASTTFLDNTYNGVAIRYRNFPDPNKTIDYAVVTASNNEAFLVLTNSKEHIYSIIDKIK